MKKEYYFISQEGDTLNHTSASVNRTDDYHAALKISNPKGRLITVMLRVEGEWQVIFANGAEVAIKLR